MSRDLIESIIAKDLVSANEMFESKLAEIQEKKLLEVKRMYAANLDEVLGPWQPGGHPDDLRAKGFKKAAPELERRDAEKEVEAPPEPKKKKEKKKVGLLKRIASSDFISQLRDIGTSNLN